MECCMKRAAAEEVGSKMGTEKWKLPKECTRRHMWHKGSFRKVHKTPAQSITIGPRASMGS